jgi:hypothetical protein
MLARARAVCTALRGKRPSARMKEVKERGLAGLFEGGMKKQRSMGIQTTEGGEGAQEEKLLCAQSLLFLS